MNDKSSIRLWYAAVLVVAAAGIFLRLYPTAGFTGIGFDENLYRTYVNQLRAGGLLHYPEIVKGYIEYQKTLPGSILPPLRFFYILSGYCWSSVFHTGTLISLHQV